MKSNETKKRFIELRAKGISFSKISESLKVSKKTLIEWSRELEREITNLKAIEMEELQEMYYVQKRKRIELFGKQLEQIMKELDQRNFSDMSTEKLLELQLKYLDYLKREEVDLSLHIEERTSLDEAIMNMGKSIKTVRV
ncbi:hypothetical protein CN533_04950 [Priestia megaterium]|uniref:hypothetical protein n=1 Tax=Priestia megaterium TaxID=1404 RepID=UPI000BF49009|nr:hypothetical protein [Priestia megaterium]PET72754.1 hypothetical protein CN533_04950 [Priestia megaterium]PFK88874.1 hypothetical protein COJ19_04240 [Priestia megaterium]